VFNAFILLLRRILLFVVPEKTGTQVSCMPKTQRMPAEACLGNNQANADMMDRREVRFFVDRASLFHSARSAVHTCRIAGKSTR